MPVPLDLNVKTRTEEQLAHIQDRLLNSFSMYSWSYFQEVGEEIDYEYLKELVAVTSEVFMYEELFLGKKSFALMKKHPRFGYDMLVEGAGVGEVSMDVCLHHHVIRNQLPKPGPEYVEVSTSNTFLVNGFFKENSPTTSITYKFILGNLRGNLFYIYSGIKEIKF